MARKDRSYSHKSPSYNVQDTHRHAGINIYTYIMHNAITLSRKVKHTLPTFQGYDLARYKKCKIDIAIPRECGPSKKQER